MFFLKYTLLQCKAQEPHENWTTGSVVSMTESLTCSQQHCYLTASNSSSKNKISSCTQLFISFIPWCQLLCLNMWKGSIKEICQSDTQRLLWTTVIIVTVFCPVYFLFFFQAEFIYIKTQFLLGIHNTSVIVSSCYCACFWALRNCTLFASSSNFDISC